MEEGILVSQTIVFGSQGNAYSKIMQLWWNADRDSSYHSEGFESTGDHIFLKLYKISALEIGRDLFSRPRPVTWSSSKQFLQV